ncbi:hypothetical protein KPL74_07975 [Bacillus sp. NP157]|nr:hypothetical protein KPL74_07975 [Bacillus sp. NP157]
MTKHETNCIPDTNRLTWARLLILPLAAFAIVEFCISCGVTFDFLSGLQPYGLINAFEAKPLRRAELAAHFATQLALLPFALLQLVKAIGSSNKPLTIKNAAQGAFLASLMSAFLFIPRYGQPNAPAKRRLFITPLIEQFNLAYVLLAGSFMFILALGIAVVAAWILKSID